MKFTSAQQSAVSNGVKALVYGGAGTGKTVLAATLGPGSILISAESGLLSLKQANLERCHGAANASINYNLPVIEVSSAKDFQDALAWCQQSHEARQFHTIGLDSVSEIGETVLNHAKRTVKDPRQAYGEMSEKMETLVRGFRDLQGKHVYFSAKMEPMKDELTGTIKYGPSMPGRKLPVMLPYFFDEVFRLGVNKTPDGQVYRFLQTQPDMQFEAKDRSGALAPIEPPHLGYVFNKILGA